MKKDEQKAQPKHDAKEERICELEAKVAELTDTAKRVAAEFDNYRKRMEKVQGEVREHAAQRVIGKLLPVLDSFELALKSTEDVGKFTEGMKLLHAQLMDALRAEGLEPINAAGGKFDPYAHEALLSEESDKPEGTILEELQRGYKLNGAVLRHSKVKIAKQRAKEEGHATGQ